MWRAAPCHAIVWWTPSSSSDGSRPPGPGPRWSTPQPTVYPSRFSNAGADAKGGGGESAVTGKLTVRRIEELKNASWLWWSAWAWRTLADGFFQSRWGAVLKLRNALGGGRGSKRALLHFVLTLQNRGLRHWSVEREMLKKCVTYFKDGPSYI